MEMCECHARALETSGVTPHTPKGIGLTTAVMNHNTAYLPASRRSYCCVFLVVMDITNCLMMTDIVFNF